MHLRIVQAVPRNETSRIFDMHTLQALSMANHQRDIERKKEPTERARKRINRLIIYSRLIRIYNRFDFHGMFDRYAHRAHDVLRSDVS